LIRLVKFPRELHEEGGTLVPPSIQR